MTGLKWASLVVIVAWIAWGVRVYRICTRARRSSDQEPVSTAWLVEHRYWRGGDKP